MALISSTCAARLATDVWPHTPCTTAAHGSGVYWDAARGLVGDPLARRKQGSLRSDRPGPGAVAFGDHDSAAINIVNSSCYPAMLILVTSVQAVTDPNCVIQFNYGAILNGTYQPAQAFSHHTAGAAFGYVNGTTPWEPESEAGFVVGPGVSFNLRCRMNLTLISGLGQCKGANASTRWWMIGMPNQ
jgi:hypothetical protein